MPDTNNTVKSDSVYCPARRLLRMRVVIAPAKYKNNIIKQGVEWVISLGQSIRPAHLKHPLLVGVSSKGEIQQLEKITSLAGETTTTKPATASDD